MQTDRAPYPALPEIHVWLSCYQDLVDPALLARLGQLMNPCERAQQQRFLFEDDRLRYLVTRAMVRTVLSRHAPVAPADWAFTVNDYGRPELAAQHGMPGLHFNLSHTRGMIALAVSRQGALGIDIENIRLRPAPLDVAEHYFAPAEVAALATLPPAQRHARFFAYWTLKESYIKARGMGLSLPLDCFHFSFPGPTQVALTVEPEAGDAAEAASWQFWQGRPTPDTMLALCAQRTGAIAPAIHVHTFMPARADQPFDVDWERYPQALHIRCA
jgi:4'-phosphopantetheinyl transferase